MNIHLVLAQQYIDLAQEFLNTAGSAPTNEELSYVRTNIEFANHHIDAFYKEQQK